MVEDETSCKHTGDFMTASVRVCVCVCV